VFTQTGERLHVSLGLLPIKKQKGVTAEALLLEDVKILETALGITITDKVQTGDFGAVIEFDLETHLTRLGEAQSLSTLGFTSLPGDVVFQKISPYPFIIRDVAVFVPESVAADMVHDVILTTAGTLRVKSWLFDVFTKETDGIVRHSYAFRMIFQSFERTLEESDVAPAVESVYEVFRAKGWEIR
jgi:hypothetical protein